LSNPPATSIQSPLTATTAPRLDVPTEAGVASGVILSSFGQPGPVPPLASENSRCRRQPRREPGNSFPELRLRINASLFSDGTHKLLPRVPDTSETPGKACPGESISLSVQEKAFLQNSPSGTFWAATRISSSSGSVWTNAWTNRFVWTLDWRKSFVNRGHRIQHSSCFAWLCMMRESRIRRDVHKSNSKRAKSCAPVKIPQKGQLESECI